MAITTPSQRWHQAVANTGAFLVPGIALCVPSGYSYGAVVLLLGAILSAPIWTSNRYNKATWCLAAMYLIMAFLWSLDINAARGLGSLDKPSKYLLAIPCIFFLVTFRPKVSWLLIGVASGAISSGALALYQIYALKMDRATGFTNAIQYGNLSLLMAAMSAVALFVLWHTWRIWQRCVFAAAMLFGALASVLSQSRGGWLALVLLLPVAAWLLARVFSGRLILLLLSGLSLGLAFASQTKSVESRIYQARSEVELFRLQGDAESSVGSRLAHWQLAIQMGLDKPVFGWGRAGYIEEKARRVDLGQAHPTVKEYGHVHNEILELFVKRGIFGVIILLAFYLMPLIIFWPTIHRVYGKNASLDRERTALCLIGILIPLFYIGFGLTQVFLSHNSGNMFYLFMCALVHAALAEQRARVAKA